MPLKKILFRPGVAREQTRYASETIGSVGSATQAVGGWYESEKVRFRSGSPEKIGGWVRISAEAFIGVCRSLWSWVTLAGINIVGVGTSSKFYLEQSGTYYDITPIRSTDALTNPFTATLGSPVIAVVDVGHGAISGDYVTFSGATGLGGAITASVLNDEHEVTVIDDDNYTVNVGVNANATDVSGSPGGGAVTAQYQINIGPDVQVPAVGWGSGAWGSGGWGTGIASNATLRIWSQNNFGEDLVFGPRGGPIYYWSAQNGYTPATVAITIASPAVLTGTLRNGTAIMFNTTGSLPTGLSVGTVYYVVGSTGSTYNVSATFGGPAINTSGSQSGVQTISSRGIAVNQLGGASDVPLIQNLIFVSDVSRFVFAFGCNDLGSVAQNPMLIRWSDQESVTNWTPAATNQAGGIQLSKGSEIITAVQTRQEIVVFTDSSLYSLQYFGPPAVWQSQLLGDNISIIGQNAVSVASGKVYFMGVDKFYVYDGRLNTLRCDLRQYIFSDINLTQNQQVFSGTNEGFNEVWWFYCSGDSTVIDKYVVYNYVEDIWHYGTMGRTAWLDSGIRDYPLAATYSFNLVNHELGVDDNETGTPAPIAAFIGSSEFDIDDGHNFGFIWRVLPDLTFRGSTGGLSPQCTVTLIPYQNSGSGPNDPLSTANTSSATIARTSSAPVEEFTGQVYIRVRGRQIIFQIESNRLGTTWQLGAPRIDIKTDGRRGNT
jgi:hypothetical protein